MRGGNETGRGRACKGHAAGPGVCSGGLGRYLRGSRVWGVGLGL